MTINIESQFQKWWSKEFINYRHETIKKVASNAFAAGHALSETEIERLRKLNLSSLDKLPARYNLGFQDGLKCAVPAIKDYESEITRLKRQLSDDNADLTLQVLAAETEVECLRSQTSPPLGEIKAVLEAARCIHHWHDSCVNKETGEAEGMVVSASHVRLLWEAIAKYDEAVASVAASPSQDVFG